jgi:hypothetical protein
MDASSPSEANRSTYSKWCPNPSGAGFSTAYPLCRTQKRQDITLGLLSYEANEDPVGTTDLEIFVLRFFAFFVALLAAFLSAFFAIFRNLLCLTMMRSSEGR